MRGALCFLVLVVVTLFCVLEAAPNGRKSQLRYLNSMPQFGKAKLTAWSPPSVMFDQVPQGYITDYSTIDARVWNFSTLYTSLNITAASSPTDLDSDTFATVYTYQFDDRKLKNKMIYDTSRSTSPRKGLLRSVNLAQYDYGVKVYNVSAVIFPNVTYGAASNYKEVDPGDYYFSWAIIDGLKRNIEGRNTSKDPYTIRPGKAYTLFFTPLDTIVVQDGTKKTVSVRNELASITAEAAPQSESVKEENGKVEQLKDQKKNNMDKESKVNAKRGKRRPAEN